MLYHVVNLILISSKLVDIPKKADLGRNFAMQLYWNHTSAWVISCKFVAFLQNTFSEENLLRAASWHLNYKKKSFILSIFFFQFIDIK